MRREIRRRRVASIAALSLLASGALTFAGLPASALSGADVAIETSASPDPVEVGQELVLTLGVSNHGAVGAEAVTVTDVLAGTLELVEASSSSGSCSGTTTVVCSLGTMTPGQTETVTMRLTPTTAGEIANTATVTALVDVDPTNNADVTMIEVMSTDDGGGGGGIAADLALAMGVTPNPGAVGAPLIYAITVANAGPDAAEGVTLVDTLPAGVTPGPVSSSQGSCSGTMVVTCALGQLANGSNATVTIGVVPNVEGAATNGAVVASSTLDPNPLDNQVVKTTTIEASGTGTADVAVGIGVFPDPGIVGAQLTYSVSVVNAGPDAAEGVTLVSSPPAGATLGPVSASQGGCSGTTVVTCSLGALPSGSKAEVTIGVVPTAEGVLSTSALVASSTADPNPLNNQATRSTTVTEAREGTCTVTGTDGDDILRGTAGKDVVCGLDGADRLVGLRGRDVLKGGPGDDVIGGGAGNDRLVSGAGADSLKGSGGHDVLKGGPGRDRFSGGAGRDRCVHAPRERVRGCE